MVYISVAYISLLILALLDNIRGPFYPDILTELQLNGSGGSLFFAAVNLFAFLASWRAGVLLKRWSPLLLLIASAFLFGAGLLGMAWSESVVSLVSTCAIYGIGYGGLALSINLLVCQEAEGERRPRLLSGLHGMYGLASLVAPLVALLCRRSGLSWRQSLSLLSILPILLASVSLFLKSSQARAKGIRVTQSDASGEVLEASEWQSCLLFAFMIGAYLWGEMVVCTRLVLWLRMDREFSPDVADISLSMFFAFMLIGRIALSVWGTGRLGNWTILTASAFFSTLVFIPGITTYAWLIPLTGLTMAPFYPVTIDEVARHFGRKGNQALGFVIGAGSLSVVFMHMTVGLVSDRYGLTLAFEICAAVVGGLSAVLLAKRYFFDS